MIIKPKIKEMNKPENWDGKYSIIYADPPWKYNDSHTGGGAGWEYDLMSIEDLCKLPIENLASDNCVLFMWATYPMLQEALDLIKAWGFTYKTIGFQWVKTSKNGKTFWGLGNWTRSNTEPCLIGVKGKPKAVKHDISQLIIEPNMKHSQKPAIVRDKIVELVGDLPRIELFARTRSDGWDCLGNEVTGKKIEEQL